MLFRSRFPFEALGFVVGIYLAHIGQPGAAAAGLKPEELTVAESASRLAVKADAATLATWQKEVEQSLREVREGLKNTYPMSATRKLLVPFCISSWFSLVGSQYSSAAHRILLVPLFFQASRFIQVLYSP